MAEPYAPQKTVYRRDAHRFVIAALFCFGAGLFAMFAWLVHPLFLLGCIPWLVLAYRMLRIGVFVSNDGVVVRNVLRSRRVPWSDVERFDWGTAWNGGGGSVLSFPVGCVYLRDGGCIRSTALNPPFELERGQSGAVPQALAGLNDELAHARAAGLTEAPTPPERPLGPTGPGPQLTLDA
jgi:hypothetical protein